MVLIKGYDISSYNCQTVSLNNMLEFLIQKDVKTFSLSTNLIINDKKVLFVDKENPIMYMDNFIFTQILMFNDEYYYSHREQINSIVASYINSMNSKYISIKDDCFLTDEVIQAIIDNKIIKNVYLLNQNEDKPFLLDEELYIRFKKAGKLDIKTDGVTEDLKDNFDSIIDYNRNRFLVAKYKYRQLVSGESLILESPLTENEILNLKYLNSNTELEITYDDYDNIFRLIEILENNGHDSMIILRLKNKNKFNNYLFNNLDVLKNQEFIKIKVSNQIFPLNVYYNNEKKLFDIVSPVIKLSPFEKYLYVYDVVNKYKKYKENKEDKSMSRDLYKLLDNEYMVCVGFSDLLRDLLSKLGIETCEYSVTVDTGLDDVPLDTRVMPDFISGGDPSTTHEVLTKASYHARLFVNLVDPKYEIDGYYIADPTWDNDMENHAFNYALMTHDEFNSTDRYNYFSMYGIKELFFVHSLEEFYYKLNIILDKNLSRKIIDYIKEFVDFFQQVDFDFYQKLIKKYSLLEKSFYEIVESEKQNILLDIGEHILDKTNNLVDGKKFKSGITSLYENGVWQLKEEENIEDEVNKIMEYNKKRHEFCFPTRYMIDRNGVEIVMMNAVNKFDIETKKVSKI